MTRHRMLANASFRLLESKVTHGMSGSTPDDVRVCQFCGTHFRPKRSWQKQCSHRCRQRAYVKRSPIKTFGYFPLVENVIRQTKERVVKGNSHVEGKVLSLFEPHTEVIRKGKAHKPNEFGRLVRIDEVENGIVSGYKVLTGNPADTTAWVPALEQHQACFGQAPEMATGDRGFFSAKNEQEAHDLGVKKVALPARGRLSAKRAEQQKQRWFRRALRWRAGIEATMSTLKHPFSMARATYKGGRGFERYVGWCVITKNLFSIARYQQRRRDRDQVS